MSNPPSRRPAVPRALSVEVLESRDVPSFGAVGGESIAVGEVISNGSIAGFPVNEYVTGTGPGIQGRVRIYDNVGNKLQDFQVFPGFTGGVNVAVGDIDGDGLKEIIVGAGEGGGPIVQVYDLNGKQLASFFAYESTFRGGVNVAAGNVNGTRGDEIVTGSGTGGGPVVGIFSGTGVHQRSFYAYEPSFRNGVNVAVGNLDLSVGTDEIVTGTGVGGGPLVKVFDGTGTFQRGVFVFNSQLRTGVTVAVGNTEATTQGQVFAAPDVSPAAVTVINVLDGLTFQSLGTFQPFPPGYTSRINMAVGDVTTAGVTGDLSVVSGEGAFDQTPRVFYGANTAPAGFNGP